MPGARAHPQPHMRIKKAHELQSPQVRRKRSGIPCANGFNGFLRALLGDRAFLPPSPDGSSHKLDASVGAPGPHDFAVRLKCTRQLHRKRPSHPALHVRDDRDTPLLMRGGTAGISNAVSSKRRSGIFFSEGLDTERKSPAVPVGKSIRISLSSRGAPATSGPGIHRAAQVPEEWIPSRRLAAHRAMTTIENGTLGQIRRNFTTPAHRKP